LESKEEKKYEDYLDRIRSFQKEVHRKSASVQVFESLAETDEERIKKWKEKNRGKETNPLYLIYNKYLEIEKSLKLTPQQEDSKKEIRQEIKKTEGYEDWRSTLENSDLSEAFANDKIDKWRTQSNFDVAGDVKNLFSVVVEKKDEFVKEIKEKYSLGDVKGLVNKKSPKKVITIIKRFEYDRLDANKEKRDAAIKQYYLLKENSVLTNEQISNYLYRKAIG